jgi:hypothetical protein
MLRKIFGDGGKTEQENKGFFSSDEENEDERQKIENAPKMKNYQ